jgi:hypothetical protein
MRGPVRSPLPLPVGRDPQDCSTKVRRARADGQTMSATTLGLRPAPLTALLSVLSQQEALLDRLQMVATTLRLLLAAGNQRHLSTAADEHGRLRDALHALDAVRAVHAEHLAEVCGAAADAGLSQLAEALGGEAAADLRTAGQRLAARAEELERTQEEVMGLAHASSARSAEVLQRLSTGAPGAYGGAGRQPAVAVPVWVDARA